MGRQAHDLIGAVGPHATNIQRAGRAARPDVASDQVGEGDRHFVRGGVGHPQASEGGDDDVALRHCADITCLLAHAAIGGRAHRRIEDQRVMPRLEEICDAVQAGAVPVVCRDGGGRTAAAIGQLGHRVGGAEFEQLVVARKQHCQRAVSLHQLMNDANRVRAEVAGGWVDQCVALARADAAVLVDDAIGCDQGKASRQIQWRVLGVQPVEARG